MEQKWIGDRVRIISKGIIGIYEGEGKNGHARIKVDQSWQELPLSDLEWIQDDEDDALDLSWINISQPEKTYQKVVEFESKIDLHIEQLNETLLGSPPGRIMEYQLLKCREFLQQASNLKVPNISIIHGRGKGVLAAEVENLVKDFPEVSHWHTTLNGGGMDVWFQYFK